MSVIYMVPRVKAVQERLMVIKENARFEFAALFHSTYSRVKKRGNFKICIFFDYPESFLYCMYSTNIYEYCLMIYSFLWYIVFFFIMLSFRSMCKSLRDKKSSIQFLVLFSKFNFLKMPIKSIENCIFCIFLVLWHQKKHTKDKKPEQVAKLLL